LGLIGLTGGSLILTGIYLGAIPADPSRIIEKIFDRFLVVVILVPLIGILVSILVASKVTAPVHAIIEKTERSRAGRKGMFKTFLRTPITVEHKQLYQSVSAMVNELEKREEYAQYFASHVVHELSNPLSAIQGALEIMKEDQSTMSPDERLRFLQIIENNLSSLTQLVDELHAQTKKDRLLAKSSSEIDLQEIADTITGYFSERNVDIQIEMKSKKIKLTLSSVALESIIRSLIDNSIKHCEQDVSIAVRLETLGSPESKLQIDVSDDGPGIPDSLKDRIFDDFFTTDKDRSTGGMGLANVKKLLEGNDGSIELLDSEKGSKFRLSIPILEGS
jgi:signal transduction histidine kinase